jgi:hypothetical protein
LERNYHDQCASQRATREILAGFHKDQQTPSWPTAAVDRTISDLRRRAEAIQHETSRKNAEKAARQRARRLTTMAADPEKTLRETDRLVKQRSGEAYRQIAHLLADLREALADTNQASLADGQARKLRERNPTLRLLTGELRKKGFLKK